MSGFDGIFVMERERTPGKTTAQITCLFVFDVPEVLVNSELSPPLTPANSNGRYVLGELALAHLEAEAPGITAALDSGTVVWYRLSFPVADDATSSEMLSTAQAMWEDMEQKEVRKLAEERFKFAGRWVPMGTP